VIRDDRRALGIVEALHLAARNDLADRLLEQPHVLFVVRRHEAHRVARGVRTSRASDAMHVILGMHREVEVHDV